MSLLDRILELDGIVIRKIPMQTKSTYIDRETGEFYSEYKENSLGGLFLVTFKGDQFSTVSFHKDSCGQGTTIEAAFKNLKQWPVDIDMAAILEGHT